MDWAPWITLVLPATALLLTLFNVFAWPRGRSDSDETPFTSVLIPARNEEQTIEAAVRSALAEPVGEVIVCDDHSTDQTASIVADIAAADDRLRLISGAALPDGWVGKPHACHQLAAAAEGELLFFVDADVTLQRGALKRMASLLRSYEAEVVTAVPRQRMGSFVERLVIPLLHVTYVSWLPLPLVWRTRDSRFLAANGQLLAVTREAYDDIGGFSAVRDAVVDDMAFCSLAKRAGHRVVFADGHEIASCRMYTSATEVWEGFSKNVFEGLGSGLGLVLAVGLYLATFVWPWIAAAIGGSLLLPGLAAVGVTTTQRVLLAVRHDHPAASVLLAPLGVLVLCAIAVNSWLWNARDAIVWSGRSYARKGARGG